jgi:hypothetical protein
MRCATTLLVATGFVLSGRSFSARVIRETAHARDDYLDARRRHRLPRGWVQDHLPGQILPGRRQHRVAAI